MEREGRDGGEIRVRDARPEDAGLIHAFVSDLAAYERAPDEVEATVEAFRDQLASDRPPFGCLLAERGSTPVGFALFFFNYSTWKGRSGLYVEDIYVVPEERGRGVGRRLLFEIGRIARSEGCGRIELSVLDWNAPSIAFYESMGAKPMNEWTTYRIFGEALERLGRGDGGDGR